MEGKNLGFVTFYFTVETKYILKEIKCLGKWLIQYMSKRGLITERLLFH